jgi:methyl-accepting chemotaxis protein
MLKKVKLTIGRKIYGIIALCFVGFVGLTYLSTSQLESHLKYQKKLELKHVTEVALSVLKEENEAAQKSGTPTDEAQRRAAERVSSLRYGQNDYFFVNTTKVVTVAHIAKEQIGRNMADVKDPNGKRFIVEQVEIATRDGSGYVEYSWNRPGSEKPQPKLSYAAMYAPWGWIVATGVYIDDLDEQVWASTKGMVSAALVLVLAIVLVSAFIARRTSSALAGMTAAMRELAAGKLDVVLPGLGRRDEIGEIASAVETFKVKAVEKARQEAEERQAQAQAESEARKSAEERDVAQRNAADEKAAADRKRAMHALAGEFEAAVGHIVETVSSASSQLEKAAGTLTHTAANTQHRAGSVAAASEQASANVQSVAGATEEMTASVSEISRQVHESSKIAGEAVKQAERTDARISELSQAASRIGDVVKLITAIAEQTNLLALNATIEAARAGEAGRGFAVVASEVKALAGQTAKATDEISSQIAGMQTATQESVGAIKEIGSTIGRIAEITHSIAAAVEEQGAATNEIAGNVQQAARGTAEVAANITEVNQGAAETGSASAQVLSSAKSLAKESGQLKHEVARFLDTVRAA